MSTVPAPRLAPDPVSPPVSVIVATKDRETLLLRAVTAIAGQHYGGPIEIIVVRDGTHSDALAADFAAAVRSCLLAAEQPVDRVELRQVPNSRRPGLPGGRNTGILAASHDLVAFCDDDDEWLPGKLAGQVPLLQRSPETALVASGIVVVNDGVPTPRPGPLRPTTLEDLLADRIMELHPSTFLLRREDLLGPVGLVDEDLPGGYAEDYDLLLRAAAVGPVLSVPRPLVRVHWTGASYYFSRWETIDAALSALLAKHPQFAQVPRGQARVRGQQAVALAAMGRRQDALRAVASVLRLSPREPRAYVAAAVATGAVSVEGVQRFLHRHGRGL